jgi:L-fuconolactonase
MVTKIVDTHIHIWDLEKAAYPWLSGDESILNRSYSLQEIETERQQADITIGVLVQASGNLVDTSLMLDAARQHDWIGGVVAWLPLMDPVETQRLLQDKFLKEKYFKGVRHQTHDEADPEWLLQPAVLESLHILAALDIPYDMVGINTAHLETALKLAEQVPALRIVLDHMNQPPIAQGLRSGEWHDLISAAAKHSNFYAKISGLGTTSGKNRNWTSDDIKPYVEFLIDRFGTDRCFCGGDWPVSLLAGNYVQTWEKYKKVVAELVNEKDQEKIFYNNAMKYYSL